jgi:hypothetical protein
MTDANDELTAEAFGVLLEQLADLRRIFGQKPLDRQVYINGLIALSVCIRSTSGEEAATALLRLVVALADLEDGIVPALLKPTKVQNRSDSSLEWSARAGAALALECLLRSDKLKEAAARQLEGNSKIPAKNIINWHHHIKAGHVKNVAANTLWQQYIARIEAGAYSNRGLLRLSQDLINFAREIGP